MKKRIAILGSTGSIGRNTCEVVRQLRNELEIVALAARADAETIRQQALEFRPRLVALTEPAPAASLSVRLNGVCKVVSGPEALEAAATIDEADLVVTAVVGAAGLRPTLAALEAGKDVALATKEALVMAGPLVMELAQRQGRRILPIDSEQSAIFQCLEGQPREAVRRLILTASGGPFLGRSADELRGVTPAQALDHPNWSMGDKVTIDSATLMNKGLEVIEARWLFGVEVDKIAVLIHPQSLIHSMVEFVDGALLAQMSEPDMRVPIQYALTYPRRLARQAHRPFDFAANPRLTFDRPDPNAFPCLALACAAGRIGGTMPAVLNAANEVAVERFLKGEIAFTDIPVYVEQAMGGHSVIAHPTLEEILFVDTEVRKAVVCR